MGMQKMLQRKLETATCHDNMLLLYERSVALITLKRKRCLNGLV